MGLDIHYDSQGPRAAFRATLPGLTLELPGGQQLPLRDLSAGGLSFVLPRAGHLIVQGTEVRANLSIAGKVYIESLPCKIVRITDTDLVAVAFENLSRLHEARIDKLVLEIQKRLIAQRKTRDKEYAESAASAAPLGADSAHSIRLNDPNLD